MMPTLYYYRRKPLSHVWGVVTHQVADLNAANAIMDRLIQQNVTLAHSLYLDGPWCGDVVDTYLKGMRGEVYC